MLQEIVNTKMAGNASYCKRRQDKPQTLQFVQVSTIIVNLNCTLQQDLGAYVSLMCLHRKSPVAKYELHWPNAAGMHKTFFVNLWKSKNVIT